MPNTRYRKFNLYVEKYLSRPDVCDVAFFDADFGRRVGLFVCFDINYSGKSDKSGKSNT